ncbi:hypothetical protein KM043_005033 [Ampulex compressa]|nr:hypothetical protein KM043_005033 [Ampulex compressa]
MEDKSQLRRTYGYTQKEKTIRKEEQKSRKHDGHGIELDKMLPAWLYENTLRGARCARPCRGEGQRTPGDPARFGVHCIGELTGSHARVTRGLATKKDAGG